MLIVRAFIDHAITIAVWTRFSFHGASSVLFQGGISTLIHQLLYQGQRRRSPLPPLASSLNVLSGHSVCVFDVRFRG
jgi:hypothetical protein